MEIVASATGNVEGAMEIDERVLVSDTTDARQADRAEKVATIVVFSDTHLADQPDRSEAGPDGRLEQAVALAAVHHPDLVLLTGDIADDGSVDAYHRTTAIVGQLGAPVVAIAGNHDVAGTLEQCFPRSPVTTLGNWRVIAIDTTIAGSIDGRVDLEALAALLGPDTGQPTVLAMHHPAITTSTHQWFQLDGAAEFVATLSLRRDVRLVVSGHLHQAFHVNLGGVSFVGCSSTWYSLHHHGDAYWPDGGHVGALLVVLHGDGTADWQRLPDPGRAAYVPSAVRV